MRISLSTIRKAANWHISLQVIATQGIPALRKAAQYAAPYNAPGEMPPGVVQFLQEMAARNNAAQGAGNVGDSPIFQNLKDYPGFTRQQPVFSSGHEFSRPFDPLIAMGMPWLEKGLQKFDPNAHLGIALNSPDYVGQGSLSSFYGTQRANQTAAFSRYINSMLADAMANDPHTGVQGALESKGYTPDQVRRGIGSAADVLGLVSGSLFPNTAMGMAARGGFTLPNTDFNDKPTLRPTEGSAVYHSVIAPQVAKAKPVTPATPGGVAPRPTKPTGWTSTSPVRPDTTPFARASPYVAGSPSSTIV